MSLQVSDAAKLRAPRGPRIAPVVVLACWAIGALLFAALPEDSLARSLTATAFTWTATAFAALVFAAASRRAAGFQRTFWTLFAAGMLFRLLGNVLWTLWQVFGVEFGTPLLMPQDLAYAVSYALLAYPLLRLVRLTARSITLVSALDALAVMLSVGTLAWFFALGAGDGGLGTWRDALVALSQPVCDAALLFLGLVVMSSPRKPRFVEALNAGLLTLLVSDLIYLQLRSGGPYESGNWPEMLWALGIILLGIAALKPGASAPVAETRPEPVPEPRIEPWRILAFWLGPLSPPVHFAVMFAWSLVSPPLPGYVIVGAAVLLIYLSLRVALVSFVSRRLGDEREALARELEQSRILYELHDTVKQNIHGVSLTLRAALDAARRGESEASREMLERALRTSSEAEFQISRPYDELQAFREDIPPRTGEFFRHRLKKFEEYFGIKTHDDLQASLEDLSPAQTAAVTRIIVESFWNVAKHSGARNMYLESRRVGALLIVRIRDDGRGFDPDNPPPGLGLRYMRQRAAEVGAKLDVISTPGRGTTVQLRFEK